MQLQGVRGSIGGGQLHVASKLPLSHSAQPCFPLCAPSHSITCRSNAAQLHAWQRTSGRPRGRLRAATHAWHGTCKVWSGMSGEHFANFKEHVEATKDIRKYIFRCTVAQAPWCDNIMDGQKTIEMRKWRLPAHLIGPSCSSSACIQSRLSPLAKQAALCGRMQLPNPALPGPADYRTACRAEDLAHPACK